MAQIFISYAREDVDKAAQLAEALKTFGHQVWWDRELLGGEDFKLMIERYLSKAAAVITLWTENSVGKPWVIAEASLAQGAGSFLPVRYVHGVSPGAPLDKFHMEFLGNWNGRSDAPEMDQLNRVIAGLEDERRRRALAGLTPTLRRIIEGSALIRVIESAALPGGLRYHRFLLGTLISSATITLALYAINSRVADGAISLAVFFYMAGIMAISRLCNQLITADRRHFSNRFFDGSFSFLCLVSLLLGALISVFLVINSGVLPLNEIINQWAAVSLYVLLLLCVGRVCFLTFTVLQRRIG